MLFVAWKAGLPRKLYVVFCYWKQQVCCCCCWSSLFFFWVVVLLLLLFSVFLFLLLICCLIFYFILLLFVCFCDLLDFVTETDPDFLGRLHACTVTINRPVTDDYEWIIHTEQPPWCITACWNQGQPCPTPQEQPLDAFGSRHVCSRSNRGTCAWFPSGTR